MLENAGSRSRLMSRFVQHQTKAQNALYGSIHTMMAGDSEVPGVLQATNRVYDFGSLPF